MTDEELAAVDAWLDELEPGCDGWYIEVTLVRALRDEVERAREIVRAVAALHGDKDWVGNDEYGGWGWLTERIEPLVNQARALLSS